MTPPLLTLNGVKVWLGIDPATGDNDSYDDMITARLPLVTQWFESYCDRGLAQRVITAEEIFFQHARRVYTWAFPITEVVSVEVNGAVILGSEFIVNSNAGYFYGGPNYVWPWGHQYCDLIVVSYTGGYPPDAVPEDLAYAFATCVGVQAGVAGVSAGGVGGSGGGAIKSIGLGSGALQVAFDTRGGATGGLTGSYSINNVPTEVQSYASVLDRYVRQRV